LAIDAAGAAAEEPGLTLALLGDATLGGGAGLGAGAAVLRVRGDVDATATAIERAVGAFALGARALGAASAGRFAVPAMVVVGVRVEAAARAFFVELRVEQVGIADALAHLAQ